MAAKWVMSEADKIAMLVSMMQALELANLSVGELDAFLTEVSDYRDSIDTELHDELRKALADTSIARVLRDPKDYLTMVFEASAPALAKHMKRDAKAFYKRYTAGERISQEELNTLSSFGVWLHNDILSRLKTSMQSELAAKDDTAALR